SALVNTPPDPKALPFHKAAIACLDRTHEQAPHLSYSDKVLDNLILFYDPLLISVKDLSLLSRAAVHYIFQRIKSGDSKRVSHALLLLEGTGHLENLVRA